MPKFHDEFFRSTTSQHDQLVVDTIQCIDQIVGKYTDKFAGEGRSVPVFKCLDRKYCGQPEALLERVSRCSECMYVQKEDYGYILAPPSYQPATEKENAVRTTTIVDTSTQVETEKIYANPLNGFIIGYADIVAQIRVDLLIELVADQQSWRIDEENVFYLIIDAKPSLRSWGGPLRQVKTYMRLQKEAQNAPVYGLITTYSKINKTHLSIIEEEQVTILTMPRQTGSLEG